MYMLFFEPLRVRFADEEDHDSSGDALTSHQDEIAMKAIVAGKALGAKSAKEAAEMTAGRLIDAEEWNKIREPWERNWSRVRDDWVPEL